MGGVTPHQVVLDCVRKTDWEIHEEQASKQYLCMGSALAPAPRFLSWIPWIMD